LVNYQKFSTVYQINSEKSSGAVDAVTGEVGWPINEFLVF